MSMHNTNSNTNSSSTPLEPLNWASRFVPLPPTEFPEDDATHAAETKRPLMESNRDAPFESPTVNPNLPCLQDIAGVDPFFTPMQTPQPSQQPSASLPQKTAAANANGSTGSASHGDLSPPQVEVIGQQTPDAAAHPFTFVETPDSTPEQPQVNVDANVDLEDRSSAQKPIVEIHEYDLATKMLPKANAIGSRDSMSQDLMPQDFNGQTTPAGNAGTTEIDIASYWSQDNVSSFMPGITPVEAYPVCQEYVEQISASGESESITLSDIELEQLLTTAASIKSKTDAEDAGDSEITQADDQSLSLQQADIALEAEAEAQPDSVTPNLVPLQVDPFGEDTFESTIEVCTAKISNQLQQSTSASLTEENTTNETTAAQFDESFEPAVDDAPEKSAEEVAGQEASAEELETQSSPAIVPHMPNLAARQVASPATSLCSCRKAEPKARSQLPLLQ